MGSQVSLLPNIIVVFFFERPYFVLFHSFSICCFAMMNKLKPELRLRKNIFVFFQLMTQRIYDSSLSTKIRRVFGYIPLSSSLTLKRCTCRCILTIHLYRGLCKHSLRWNQLFVRNVSSHICIDSILIRRWWSIPKSESSAYKWLIFLWIRWFPRMKPYLPKEVSNCKKWMSNAKDVLRYPGTQVVSRLQLCRGPKCSRYCKIVTKPVIPLAISRMLCQILAK